MLSGSLHAVFPGANRPWAPLATSSFAAAALQQQAQQLEPRAGGSARTLLTTRAAAASAALAPVGEELSDELVSVPVHNLSKRNPDGTPTISWVQVSAKELQAAQEAAVEAAERLEAAHHAALGGLDLHRLDTAAAPSATQQIEIPGQRFIDDPAELSLIGRGLPIIHGVRDAAHFRLLAYGAPVSPHEASFRRAL